MKLSILVPVYNERAVVTRSLSQVLTAPLPAEVEREIIIVDDCSTDGTSEILQQFAGSQDFIRLLRHDRNQGKGAAIRTAIRAATGDFTLVQDADLEYDPSEYPRLLKPLLDGRADAVFGSRYMAGEQMRVLPFWHSMINKFLTVASNMFSNLNVTDMETCYKVFRTDILKSIPIRSDRFGFEPEITMKCGKRKLRIYEVPISYHGRTYEEGKKIGWKDGVKALGVILHFWLIDDLFDEAYGRHTLNTLTGTPKYLSWVAATLRPHVGDTVLELGAGMGNLTGRLMARKTRYVAGEHDPLYYHFLSNRFLRTPNVEVRRIDPNVPETFAGMEPTETVLCVNCLEYAEDTEATLESIRRTLLPGGRLVILAPQSRSLFGSVDRMHGHKRRFAERELRDLLVRSGFRVEGIRQFNRASRPAWWFFSRLLKRSRINKFTLKLFDKSVWLWRRLDWLLPWKGLSLIVVARKAD